MNFSTDLPFVVSKIGVSMERKVPKSSFGKADAIFFLFFGIVHTKLIILVSYKTQEHRLIKPMLLYLILKYYMRRLFSVSVSKKCITLPSNVI